MSRSRRHERRRGVVAPLVAVSLIALLGVCALVLDVGFLQDRKRNLQAACDASALAGAADIFLKDPTALDNPTATPTDVAGATASATEYAKLNGYVADGTNTFVTINVPPKSGLFVGVNGYIEVIIEHREPRRFSAIFGSGNLPVKARAVARGGYQAVGDGIIILDRTKKGALKAGGGGTVTVTGAPIVVDSNDSEAGFGAGGGSMTTDKSFQITGGVNNATNFIGTLNVGTTPIVDPMRGQPIPDKNQLPTGSDSTTDLGSGNTLHTLSPGVYAGGLSFSGKDSVFMAPGLYYMDQGGFSFAGQGSMTANGVMIYNDPTPNGNNQGLSVTGQGSVTWSAPTSGTYPGLNGSTGNMGGISYFQDRADGASDKITGNGLFNISGLFYAASADVKVAGNGDVQIGSQFISRTLDVQGNGSFNVTYNPNTAPRVRKLQLVE
jgi:hypothetical protein